MSDVQPLLDAIRTPLFADAERVCLAGADGRPAQFVVLAMLDLLGQDYAMMAREEELAAATDGDLSVYLFGLEWDDDGAPHLSIIDNDDLYAEVFHLFAALDDEEA